MSRILHDRFVKVQNIVEETPQTKSFVLDLGGELLELKVERERIKIEKYD
jgi:hypothetical protein